MVNINLKNYSNIFLLKKLLPYYGEYKKILALDLFFVVLTVFCDLTYPTLIKHTVDSVSRTENISIIAIVLVVPIYIFTAVLEIIGTRYKNYIGHLMGAKMETKMRSDLFAHLQNLQLSYHESTKTGQLVSRLSTDLFDVTEFAHHFPEEILSIAIRFTTLFFLMVKINILLTFLTFFPAVLLIIFILNFNKKMKKELKKIRNQMGELTNQAEDSLLGIKVVKSFANEQLENEKFNEENFKMLNTKKKYYTIIGNFYSVDRIFYNLTFLVPLIGGLVPFFSKTMTPGQMASYVSYTTLLVGATYKVLKMIEKFQVGISGINRFVEIMETKITLKNSENNIKLTNSKGKIEFKNVWFKYFGEDNFVLKNINFTINPKEKIALIGASGAGKTTICNLLERFYDLESGEILIDGINVKNINILNLHKIIGTVQQDVFLFTGSIKDNIIYGNPKATKKQLEQAAKKARIHEFIESLPEKYNTLVGERGFKLSGGQKQRISIARTFLKQPKILILDEATSALDSENEKQIKDSIKDIFNDITTITIAHKLPTIKNADRIFLVQNGKITATGPHQELIKTNLNYKKLFKNYYF